VDGHALVEWSINHAWIACSSVSMARALAWRRLSQIFDVEDGWLTLTS
jgi:hypothetical protein